MTGDPMGTIVGFDLWVAGRSKALTRFAYLVTGDRHEAEHALQAALASACAKWTRVSRTDDPEAGVRKMIVRAHLSTRRRFGRRRSPRADGPAGGGASGVGAGATKGDQVWGLCRSLPARQRAAVVLRCFGDLGYPQIADVLACSQPTVRADIRRALEMVRRSLEMQTTVTDDELEGVVRRTLSRHADDVPDHADRTEAAHVAVRRRRLRAAVVGAAAAVVLAPLAVVGAMMHPHGIHPPVANGPTGWRAESYDGIELSVPSSWGWGGVPVRVGGAMAQCGVKALAASTSWDDMRAPREDGALEPYVGRPLPVTDSCGAPPSPDASHVWFDSPLGTGSDPKAGITIHVEGATAFNITVQDSNHAVQQAILQSVHTVSADSYGCGTQPPSETGSQTPVDPGTVTSISVCVYGTRDDVLAGQVDTSSQYLFYSTQVIDNAAAAARAIEAGGQDRAMQTSELCRHPRARLELVEHVTGGGSYVYAVNPTSCRGQSAGYQAGVEFHELTRRSVSLWAVNATALYSITGPAENQLSPLLPNF